MLRLLYNKIIKYNFSSYANIQNKAFINGSWIKNQNSETFEVVNPATGEKLSDIPNLSVNETEDAIGSAHHAFTSWSKTTSLDRANLLKKLNDLLLQYEEEISHLITLENGKSLEESKLEVKYAASFLNWFSEEARRIMGYIMPTPRLDKKLIILQQPVGVVGVITPWNFPMAMVTRKLGAILAAGCTTLIKPAEETPLSLLRFIEIVQEYIPPGVINVVTASKANSSTIGKLLCSDKRIKSIAFTGSVEVGKILYGQCADTMKRLSLELGGNAPLIIFESANLDVSIKSVMTCKFRNSGQTCISANRILVHESIHDEFVKRLLVETSKLKLGYGLDKDVNQGPLINEDAILKVEKLVNESIKLGARLEQGGQKANIKDYPKGFFFQPTVITSCSIDHPLFQKEIFGPVCAITKFSKEETAVNIANSLHTGLAAYVFSEDHRQIWRVSEQLQMGIVGINEGAVSHCEAPFAGWKESGLGTESGIFGIDEFLVKKYICWGNLY